MVGRSTRFSGRSITVQSAQQDDQSVVSESINIHDGSVDVSAPMSLGQMTHLLGEAALTTEQVQVLNDRIRQLNKACEGTLTRSHHDSDSEDDKPRKRRADHDLKYTNIKS
ncbi:hypothetical protein V1509DRAFT_640836 [Lipomyces kononenkoae]